MAKYPAWSGHRSPPVPIKYLEINIRGNKVICRIISLYKKRSLHYNINTNSSKIMENVCNAISSNSGEVKISLKEYYDNLPKPTHPKTAFVREVAKRCEKDIYTVRLWIKGVTKPGTPDDIKIISELTGIPEDELWVR